MVEDNDPVNGATSRDEGDMSEDEIDETLRETFPASDPPSWTLGTNHHQEPPVEETHAEEDDE
jgi:hypothetical protein